MRFTYLLLVPALLLSGCAYMLPHTSLSDTEAQGQGIALAAVQVCASRGDLAQSSADAYRQAMAETLAVMVYDKAQVKQGFRSMMEEIRREPPAVLSRNCQTLQQRLSREIANLRRACANTIASRAQSTAQQTAALAESNRLLQSMVNSIGAYNLQQTAPKSTPAQPRDQKASWHYLKNTSKGQVLCTVTESGYTFCQ